MGYGSGRDALVRATIEIVAEKGLQGLSHRSVAARAGVHHALVGQHFGSLDALVAAATEVAVERSIRETGLAGTADFDEAFADTMLESLTSDPEIEMFQAQMVLEAPRRPEIRALVERLYDNYITAVEHRLRARGINTSDGSHRELGRVVFGALNGLVLQFLAVGSTEPVREAIVEVGRLLTNILPDDKRPGEDTGPADNAE
ncbi:MULTISPECIES: TetR/AcrR family transcriptional regulator [Arthrobacter]|uniref:TetR family transcriptional regulator n=1 Tax=Arthrobacter terricola TaxID=2547396 RepID=A0A4R5KD64_9MICC|nr:MULTISPECIES: TetR/AcrR family transcriptional regulator [Arthrobacter]MBT8162671.1 TetR family transcriptional regulator [Arthrobacter sp. GN70]TDF92448.1 TetR family transcriptional regulator [Arthrobacter terricola]